MKAVSATYTAIVHVNAETMQDAKELAYYVAENILEAINGDYLYSELINPVFTQDMDNVNVSVNFIDN